MRNLVLFVLLVSAFSCSNQEEGKIYSIVPEPNESNSQAGFFKLANSTGIFTSVDDEVLDRTIDLFISEMNELCSVRLEQSSKEIKKRTIQILYDNTLDMPDEAYILSVSPAKIQINASSYAGIHYAFQSLKQLAVLNINEKGKIRIPSVLINDHPRFKWRGMHLDVCRHFIPLEDVKKYIDYLSFYKFNKFHWHLTEDQGWRIEIKKYPELTNTGAWRDETLVGHYSDQPRTYDGQRHGGYYTQDEIRELVEYAGERFIEVIPEIEMPGHARAAIASYPWLGVTGEKISVMKEWGISPYIYIPSDKTFGFLEDVLTEVIGLFPSEYIHIGGDEAIKDQWESNAEIQKLIRLLGLKDEHELQSWFIRRIEKFVNEKGKRIIGWDEILEGGLAPNATVMSWRGESGGIEAARMGHDVIMSPTSNCYFDYYQAKPVENEPLAIGGFLPLEKVYSYDPVPQSLTAEEAKHILGAQGNVWTEYIPDFKQVEYMVFPRMLAMAEITWTEPIHKDPVEFFNRVKDQEIVFKLKGINYSKSGMPE